jgi:hypothetical protein
MAQCFRVTHHRDRTDASKQSCTPRDLAEWYSLAGCCARMCMHYQEPARLSELAACVRVCVTKRDPARHSGEMTLPTAG